MTIGNLLANVCNSQSRLATILLVLLPVPPKTGDVLQWLAKVYANIKVDPLHQALRTILEPLKAVTIDGLPMQCADEKYRLCYSVLAA